MVRFFDAAAAREGKSARAWLVRGGALLALLSILAGAARLRAPQAQPAFFSLLFPQLTDWLIAPEDGALPEEIADGCAAPGEAVAL